MSVLPCFRTHINLVRPPPKKHHHLSCVPDADHLLRDGQRRRRRRRDQCRQWWWGGADPPAQQPPPRSPRGGPAGEGCQLQQPPHPPPQVRGWQTSTPTAVSVGGGSAHPAAAAALAARRTCWHRTPLHKAVAGGRPLAAQLLVCAPCRSGLLHEAMQARDASGCTLLELARAYALMPPHEAEMEGAWVRRWDAAAGGARADWATCRRCRRRCRHLQRCGVDGGVVDVCAGCVSLFRAAN